MKAKKQPIEITKVAEISNKTVTTTTRKVKVYITIQDPLFPDETIKLVKKLTIKNGAILDLDIFSNLDARYSKKIGEWWKTHGIEDRDKNGRWAALPIYALKERSELIEDRMQKVRKAAREAVSMIRKSIGCPTL